MNWHKQMEEMLSNWTETQRRAWDQWMDAVKGMAPGAEHVQAQYHQQLDAWEQSVREALQRQKEWAESLSNQAGQGGAQQEMAEQWMEQVQQAMKGWTEAQSQLWNTWMENIKRMESSGSGEMPWAMGGGEEVVKAWQKAAEQAQKTMQEWSQATGASGSGGSGSSGKGKSS
jgi:hypothetical protein